MTNRKLLRFMVNLALLYLHLETRLWCICSLRRRRNGGHSSCSRTSTITTTTTRQEFCSLCRSQVERSIMVFCSNVRLCPVRTLITCAAAEAWLRFKVSKCRSKSDIIITRWCIQTRARLQTLIIRRLEWLKTHLKMIASKGSQCRNITPIIISNSQLHYLRIIMLQLCLLEKQGLWDPLLFMGITFYVSNPKLSLKLLILGVKVRN